MNPINPMCDATLQYRILTSGKEAVKVSLRRRRAILFVMQTSLHKGSLGNDE